MHDLRHAFRQLAKAPLLCAVIIGSLGIGIGVNTTIFSWIQTVVFHPLPGVRDSAKFHLVEIRSETHAYPGLSWLEYRDLRDRLPSFRDLLAFRMVPLNVGEPGRDERIFSLLVSGNYFPALDLQPALGRFLRPDEVAQPGGASVVVISHGFWQSHFAGSPAAVGQPLRVNNRLLTVVGVAPRDFQGTVLGLSFDLWVPATLAPVLLDGSQELTTRSLRGYYAMGLLRPGTSARGAQAEVDLAMRDFARAYPDTNTGVQAEILPFSRAPRGPQGLLVKALVILQAVMVLVLLVVCANTANLLLARATVRQREMGVRLALGAGPARLAAMLLTESLVLALLGAALGLVLASWGVDALRALPLTGAFPIKFQTALDAGGLAFAVLLSLACGAAFGAAPALQLARTDPQVALRNGARSAGHSRLRNALVATEVALALIVLVVAALFLRNLQDSRATDPGFVRDGVLLAAYDLNGRGYDEAAARTVTQTMLERLRALPTVESAAIASMIPLDIHGLPSRPFALEGRARASAGEDQAISYNVTAGYFRTVGIPLLAGTDFADLADRAATPQAIVNEEFVRRYVQDGAALGRRLQSGGRTYEIVGIVRNSTYESFGEPAKAALYLSFRDCFSLAGQLHLRTRGTEGTLAPELRRIVRDINPAIQVFDVRSLSEHVERNLFLRRVPARMFAVLGPLILLLAAIGIYAVVSYNVAQRTLEIGIRRALGATDRGVIRQIVSDGLRSVGVGLLIGWLPAVVINLHLRHGALGLGTLLGVPALLLAVATLAAWLPARRATRVNPLVALRAE